MINSIFILDKSKTVVDVLSNNGDSPQSPFFDDKYVQDLATGAETFEFTTVSNERTSKYTVAGNYVAFKFKNKIKMFQIMETKEEHQEALYKSCYCEIAGLELINNVIREREIPSANVRQFFEIALADTDWKLGIVDAALVLSSNIKIERATNVYSLIQEHLSTFDMEIEYRFEMTGNRISGMYIDVYKSRGRDTGFRFEYGENVSGVSKQVDMSELCTAMVGIGKDNIDFKSVEWGADMPALKPLNQDFIVDVEAHKIWNNNGSYLMGTYTAQTESPHELLTLTWNELQRRKQPKMTYDIQVEMLQGYDDEINIGDTVKVIDNDYIPALHLTARIGRLELSFTDYRQNKCILTNFKEVKSGILSLDTIQAIIDGKFPIGSEQIQDGAITEGKIDTQYLHTIKTDVIIAAKAEVEELIADKADIKDLNAINASIENLKAKDAEIENAVIDNLKATTAEIESLKAKDAKIENLVAEKANIQDLNAINASISNLEAIKADIVDLEATNATINNLKADVAEIDTLLAGNITADNIQSGSITSNELASGTITAGSGVIADGAIGSAQISSLDAAKINAGTIDTSRVTVAGPNSNLKLSGNRLQVFNGVGSNQVERVSLGDVKGDGSQYGLLVRGADGKTVIMDENGVTNAGITDGSITNDKINPDANIDGAKLNINSVITRINEDGSESIQGAKIDIEGTSLSTKLSNITTTQTAQGNKISEHSSKIAANESAINLKVDSQTYQSDKEGIETQLNKNTADIALNKEQIALKVEQTDIDKAKSEVEGKIDTKVNAAKAEIKVTTDKISQNVSNLTTTVENKADGSTVSTLSNKVGSLETSVNGISGKVSSLETTTTSISSTATNALNKANSANTAASTAQNAANNAQNTADSKAKVFTSTPTTPYKVGDIWTAGPSGDLMKCKTARASGSYVASDWEKASKYTDDTKANAVDGKVNTLQGEVNTVKSNVATLDVNLQGITQRVSSTESTTTTLTNKVNTAQSTADAAKSAASTAQSTANTAKNNAATAQTAANNAQSTADSKAKVFTSTPTTPYKVGDLWTAGPSGDVMRCKTARASGSYTASDWEKASKYTDDTKANAAQTAANNAQNTANTANATANANKTEISNTKSKVATIETNLSGITSRVSNVETKQSTVNGKVSSLETRMSTAESKITETAITNTVKKNFYTKSETDSQITSKGYQTASQVQQTVNGLEVKVSQSGGYNLIYNGNFKKDLNNWNIAGDTSKVLISSTLSCSANQKGVRIEGTLKNAVWVHQSVPWDSNEPITLSYWQHTTANGSDGTTNPFRATQVVISYTDGTSSWHTNSGQSKYNTWEKISHTITPDSGKRVRSVQVDLWCRDTTKIVYYTNVMLEKGSLATEYTPNPNEIYAGITTIDKDGITVTNTSSSTYTQIDSESFRVENNTGGTVAEFSQNSQIPNLTAGIINANEIYSPNICTKSPMSGSIKYIVNGSTGNDNNNGTTYSTPFKTVAKAVSMLNTQQDRSVDIEIYGSVTGFDVKGINGTGAIRFYFSDDAIVNGAVIIGGITNTIGFHGGSSDKPTFKNGISIYRCRDVEIGSLTFRGTNSNGNNIYLEDVTFARIISCDLGGLSTQLLCAIQARRSNLWIYNCRGSKITDVVAQSEFSIAYAPRAGTSNVPDYSNAFLCNYDGAGRIHNWSGGNFVKTPSKGWNPAYTPTQKTQTWSFNKIWSDETLNGWSDRQELIQGYSSTWNTGRWTGYMQFTDGMAAIRSAISGGTNLSGRLYVQRRTSSGNSTGSKLCLYASDGTLITNSTTINRGQGVWVNLSSAIISKIASGAITYFYLKADSNNTATYFKCESNAKIEITYTK